MKPPKTITINGERWTLDWTAPHPTEKAWALCHWDQKRIQIHPRCDDELLLAAIIDEVCHVHFPELDNDYVGDLSDDLAKIITKLGYKRDED